MFVSWVYAHSGFSLGKVGYTKGFAGCQTAYNHFKKSGEIVHEPRPGDIVLFDWNGDGRYDHTGIFVKDLGNGQFESIEGNTAMGNDSNGGKVMRRIRNYRFAIFIHPKVLDK
jgi:cell wall-associated NlpC family hydrolase